MHKMTSFPKQNNNNNSSSSSSHNTPTGPSQQRHSKNPHRRTMTATAREEAEIIRLHQRIEMECPNRGYAPPLNQKVSFRSLPLSEATLRGLEGKLEDGDHPQKKKKKKNGQQQQQQQQGGGAGSKKENKKGTRNKKQFWIMTDIQNACIPHALKGRDILGAARTGSGKTLAFLIPLLEKLYRRQYTPPDGPGAIVLSPTRELAVQTFQVLRDIGSYHHFSAGILVGGKKEFRMEQQHVPRMNIIIATPGRLLQHLEQTAGFDVDRVCVLVLDEVDRLLDLGFRDQMLRILDYLPPGNTSTTVEERIVNENNIMETPGRQTMLFSATQTNRVSDLAALSLYRPEYLGVHDKEESKTPLGLEQSVMTVPLHHKLNAVYSFIKSHLKCKTIIFFSSCSQVRHVWQIFCTLQPGVPLMAIHGKLKQETRTKLYFDFLQRPHAVLFATDVAARGLDFPNVDWVVQADAPEDVDMYIHRVGRTARYSSKGKALLLVLPQEEQGVLKVLEKARIQVKTCSMNPNKAVLVSKKAASVVAASADMNLLAKKAFKSYLRSVHLMPNKDLIFPRVTDLPLEEYALSLGLATMPTVRFLKKLVNREEERKKKNVDYKLVQLKEEIKAERLMKKMSKLGTSGNEKSNIEQKVIKGKRRTEYEKNSNSDSDTDEEIIDGDDDDDGLLAVKKIHAWGTESKNDTIHQTNTSSSRQKKKIRIDGSSTGSNHRIVFTDDGEVASGDVTAQNNNDLPAIKDVTLARDSYLESVRNRLMKTKELDQQEERDRIQEKHKKRKMKEKDDGKRNDGGDESGNALVQLGGYNDVDSEVNRASSNSSSSSSSLESYYEESSDTHSDSASDDDEAVDVKVQEELALQMLGKIM